MTRCGEQSGFSYGDTVCVRQGLPRKTWEWIGQVELVSGRKVAVSWKMLMPGRQGYRPVTIRAMDELDLLFEGADENAA